MTQHYSDNPASCRVDVFNKNSNGHLKWYLTEAVVIGPYSGELLNVAVQRSIDAHFQGRCAGMVAIVLEPYHEHSHPFTVDISSTTKEDDKR